MMSFPPHIANDLVTHRQSELLEEAARARRVPRKRFRLLALAAAVRRSISRPSAPERPPAGATTARPIEVS